MSNAPTPVEIFCSYVHEDQAWLQRLETHLSLLRRQGLISLWHDRLIPPGTDRTRTIDQHLETASVILLLVSADFLASDYCYSIEMKRAIAREAAGAARIIPILVRPVDWQGTPFAYLQPLPTDAKPIETWESQEMALADIAAGIRRVIAEELPLISTSVPRAALPAIWNIPYPRNPFFLGRDAELVEVRCHLQAGQATALSQPQAISGLGGIGKTQLALEYAYRYQQDYQAVLWARAESTEELVASYIALAQLLRLPDYDAKEENIIVQAVKTWLQTHRGWLLILDNADELALLPDFLPPSMGGHVLLTTRAAATGRLAHRLEIETLGPEPGALFLLRRSALLAPNATLEHASAEERKLAWQISEELGGLPLALDQAGAYLEETGTSLVSYWQIYQQHRADLLEQRRGLVADHPASVATTWSLSFRQIEEKNQSAADLLRLCAFLSPDAIPEEVLTASTSLPGSVLAEVAGDSFRLNRAIEALRAYSLIRRDPKGKTLSLHRLVQAVLQDTMKEAERRSWAEQVILSVNEAFPHPDHDTWAQCERLLSQAWTATQFIEQYQIIGEEAERLLQEMAYYLWDRGRYAEGEPLYQQLLRIRELRLGPEHPKVASAIHGLADLYWRQGKYTQAEPLLLRALEISEQQLGPEHPQVASVLFGLATVYRYQGKYAQSEQLYRRELQIWEQRFGPEHPRVASSLNNLAAAYQDQGKNAKAEPLLLRALQVSEQQLGSEHYKVGYSLWGLASLYYGQGKYAEAELLYQRTLRIWEQYYGSEHPEIARLLPGLARIYRNQGKYAEAELLYRRVLRIREQRLGSEHPQVASALQYLVWLYCNQGKYTQAEPLYQRALHIWEQTFGQEVGRSHHLMDRSECNANSQALYTAIFEQGSGPVWRAHYCLTGEQSQQTFDQLTDQGYRLVNGSGYAVNGQAFFTGIFERRCSPAWMAYDGLTSEQFRQTLDRLVRRGYRLINMSGCSLNDQTFYTAIFEQSSGPAWKTYHDLTSEQLQQALDQLTDQGYRLIDVSGYSVNGQALYTAIFEQSNGPTWEAYHGLTDAQSQDLFDQLVKQGYRLVDKSGYVVNGQALFAGIFEQRSGPAWIAPSNLTSQQFRQTFDQLVGQGYRLLRVSGYGV